MFQTLNMLAMLKVCNFEPICVSYNICLTQGAQFHVSDPVSCEDYVLIIHNRQVYMCKEQSFITRGGGKFGWHASKNAQHHSQCHGGISIP